MKNITKMFSIFIMLVFSIVVFANAANALTIQEVKVNDVELASDSQVVHADRGDNLDVSVQLKGGSSDENSIRVKAWIGGYKYDQVEDVTSQFKVLADTTYAKNLELQLPDDMDSTQDYTLHVEAYGPTGDAVEYTPLVFTLRVTPVQDLLDVQDVMFNPGLTVQAGNPLYANVRVENMGDNNQKDIRVSLSIPALGISTRNYIDELVSKDICDTTECDSDKVTSANSNDLMIKIPENTKAGTYDLVVNVDYDRLHESTQKTYLLTVENNQVVSEDNADVSRIINVDTQTKEVDQGKGIIYRLTLANLGSKTETYNVEVNGVESWGTSRVDPAYVTLASDSTGETFVYVSANEDAAAGLHIFNVKVKSGDTVVKEFNLNADVKEVAKNNFSLTSMLWIVFGLLVIVVLVLGAILLVKRSKKEDAEEPNAEAQTYY
ncbi:MAG: hypothetical protein PHF86_03690 [Candidatus Nanoarchaeia archaeon]|nr:hypothetical protein [Candidatus Nanoarchaeia archaeon]